MAGKGMEYKVLINEDGSVQADVLCRGTKQCSEIVSVFNGIQGFHTDSVTDKPDTAPVFNELNRKS